jgi:hypothetical protein
MLQSVRFDPVAIENPNSGRAEKSVALAEINEIIGAFVN